MAIDPATATSTDTTQYAVTLARSDQYPMGRTSTTTTADSTVIIITARGYGKTYASTGYTDWVISSPEPEEINLTNWQALSRWATGFRGSSRHISARYTIRQPGAKDRLINKRKFKLKLLQSKL